jgi:hypothetical protein
MVKNGATVSRLDLTGGAYTFSGSFTISGNAVGLSSISYEVSISATAGYSILFISGLSKTIDVCDYEPGAW